MTVPVYAEAWVMDAMSAREGVARSVLHWFLACGTCPDVRDLVVEALRPSRGAWCSVRVRREAGDGVSFGSLL
eukprot:11590060-Alexandrium_andersonii.AAC.1